MTPWGRFKFLRASMGPSCSGDEFNPRAGMAFVDQVNTVRDVDDLIHFGQDFPANVKGVCDLLQTARTAGMLCQCAPLLVTARCHALEP
jgi:hypothetical protein